MSIVYNNDFFLFIAYHFVLLFVVISKQIGFESFQLNGLQRIVAI